jgi:hypothetical protein
MVPLKTNDIREVVQAIASVRKDTTQFHLLGITRTDFAKEFTSSGVTSLDSTSPFRQSFMDATDNFHTAERTFIALRVPQVDGKLWVHYTSIKTGEKYSCLLEAFSERFKLLEQ